MATVAECARHLCIAERTFYDLLGKGVITRQAAGAYELDEVRRQYILHLQEIAGGRLAEIENGLSAEKARLAKAQADALVRKNSVESGLFLPKEDVHVAVTSAFARVRAKLLSLPSKIAPLILGSNSPAEIRDIITDAIHEALLELASTRVAGLLASSDRPGDAGSRG